VNGALLWSAVLVALLFGSFVALARETFGRITARTVFESSDFFSAVSHASKELRLKGVRALAKSSVLFIFLFLVVLFALLAIAGVNTLRRGV
jgi:hypothetical protein